MAAEGADILFAAQSVCCFQEHIPYLVVKFSGQLLADFEDDLCHNVIGCAIVEGAYLMHH